MDDKYQSRARPTAVYAACAITTAFAGAAIAGIALDHAFVGEIMTPLWSYAGFYAWQRTKEKVAGASEPANGATA